MKFIFLFLIVSRLFSIIPTQAFYDISPYFIDSHYSPTVGKAALTSGFIYNLRFFGNYKQFYNEKNEWVPRLDKGLDPIQELVIYFFPSQPYELSIETTAYSNFAKKVSIHKIAALINYCFESRKNINKYFDVNTPPVLKRDFESMQKKLSRQYQDLGMMRDMLTNCILFEYEVDDDFNKQTNKSIYPYFTTEQIILSLFVQKFESRYDIIALLSCLNSEIVSHPFNAKVDDRWTIETVNQVKSLMEDPKYTLSIDALYFFSYYHPNAPLPYKTGMSVISNGNCPLINRKFGIFLKSTFADCHETTIRHWFNLILFDPIERCFKLPNLTNTSSLYHQLCLFFCKQGIYHVNDGSEKMRGDWNNVVGDLNVTEPFDVPIYYVRSNSNELCCGYANFIFVFKKILNDALILDPKPSATKSHILKYQWVIQSLKKIITVLNPTLTIKSISIDQFKVCLNTLCKEDYYGQTTISLINKNNTPFSFVLSHVPKHAFIDKITYDDFSIQLSENNIPELSHTLSLLKCTKEHPTSILYEMLGTGKIDDNAKKIGVLEKFKSVPDSFSPILSKVVSHFYYDDMIFLINLSKLLLTAPIKTTLFPYIQQLYIDGSFDDMNLSSARALKKIEISNQTRINTFILEPYSAVHVIGLNGSIKHIDLTDQPQIEQLNIGFFSKIEHLNFPNFINIKFLDIQALFTDSLNLTLAEKIESLTLGANVNIHKLLLPKCMHLKKLIILGKIANAYFNLESAINLDTVQMNDDIFVHELVLPASPYLQEISLCGKIKSANLEKAYNLKNVKLEGITQMDVLVYPPMSGLKTLCVQGFIECVDLSNLENLLTLNLTYEAFIKQLILPNKPTITKVNHYGQLHEVIVHNESQEKLFYGLARKITQGPVH